MIFVQEIYMKPYSFLLSGILFLLTQQGHSQCKTYQLSAQRDTLNCLDKKDEKQGKWVVHHDELRGEPGFEEEGIFKDNRREGPWRLYSLDGDLIGVEHYKWGNKDSINQYFAPTGELIREESWKALNPDKVYDTVLVEDLNHLDQYRTVVVKNEGVGLKHGEWKYYDLTTGMIIKTETYSLGKLEPPKAQERSLAQADSTKAVPKPKEVKDFEKKNSGKKKVKYIDGSVNY
jgi:hypothetical protein